MKTKLECCMCDKWVIHDDCPEYCSLQLDNNPLDCDCFEIRDLGDIIEVIDTLQRLNKEAYHEISNLKIKLNNIRKAQDCTVLNPKSN